MRRKIGQATKAKIIYNISAKENSSSSSLNDCLETGKFLKTLIWDILVISILLCRNIEKAILQIHIRNK